MSPFLAAIFLLGLCVANAINFTTVYQWDEFDFIWPSGADTSIGQIKDEYKPEKLYILFMAVFGERLFLSLDRDYGIPATLVWLPTSGTSTSPPKLAPFPSWHLHSNDKCDTIQWARSMEIDTDGLLWVLDQGSSNCSSKIWIFNLLNYDKMERVHQFPDAVVPHAIGSRWMCDIVLDKTQDDHLAYITNEFSEHLIVYSRKLDKSWSVKTPGKWVSLALSPNREARKLYLGRSFSNELYSVSVSELRNEGRSAAVKFIGTWTEKPYRMLIGSANVMYAAFFDQSYTSKWNVSEPFLEQRFHEVGRLLSGRPFIFALDMKGNLWMAERNATGGPRHKLLKAALGAKSYLFSTALTTSKPYVFSFNTIIVIWLLAFCLVLYGTVIAWLTLRMRRMQTSSRQNSMENRAEIPDDQVYDDVAPENSEPSMPENPDEFLYDEVGPEPLTSFLYNYVSARTPSPQLCEEPLRLGNANAGKPSEPVYDEVGSTEPENIYDDVGPGPSSAPSTESVQYLEVLPNSGETRL